MVPFIYNFYLPYRTKEGDLSFLSLPTNQRTNAKKASRGRNWRETWQRGHLKQRKVPARPRKIKNPHKMMKILRKTSPPRNNRRFLLPARPEPNRTEDESAKPPPFLKRRSL